MSSDPPGASLGAMVHVHCRSWAEATMAPEGKDNVTGQACVVCNRNSLDIQPPPVASGSGPSSLPRSIVSSLQAVVPLQDRDLGAITDRAQIGTFGIHEVESWEALIGHGGAK